MSLRPEPTDPADMTADERLEEVASIFARGIVRLHGRSIPGDSLTGNLADSSPACLELAAPSRPDGAAG
jgi:hypothetical protein